MTTLEAFNRFSPNYESGIAGCEAKGNGRFSLIKKVETVNGDWITEDVWSDRHINSYKPVTTTSYLTAEEFEADFLDINKKLNNDIEQLREGISNRDSLIYSLKKEKKLLQKELNEVKSMNIFQFLKQKRTSWK